MNLRLIPLLALAALVLSSCNLRQPNPDHVNAYLYTEPTGQGAFMDSRSYVFIREVDERMMVPNRDIGIRLTPGEHRVLVTARKDPGEKKGGYYIGSIGEWYGAAIDDYHGAQNSRHLYFEAVTGHNYVARATEFRNGYKFWIEDYPSGEVVAGEKPSGVRHARPPAIRH